RAGDFLAHFYHAAIANDDLHRFVAPLGVDYHGDRRSSSGGGDQDIGFAQNVRVQAHERFTAQPVSRNPKRVDVVRTPELWVLNEAEAMKMVPIARLDMLDDLFALISDDNSDLADVSSEQPMDLVVENGFAV